MDLDMNSNSCISFTFFAYSHTSFLCCTIKSTWLIRTCVHPQICVNILTLSSYFWKQLMARALNGSSIPLLYSALTSKNSKPRLIANYSPSSLYTAAFASKSHLLAITTPLRFFPWFSCLMLSCQSLRSLKESGFVQSQTKTTWFALHKRSIVISLKMFYPAMSIKCNSTDVQDWPSIWTSLRVYSHP